MTTKVYLIDGLEGNPLTQGIAQGGEVLRFGTGGRYLGTGEVAFAMGHFREIDIVSILNVENSLELAYVIGNTFKQYTISVTIQELVRTMNILDNMIFVGRRIDMVGGIAYSQYLYGFKKGCLNEQQLLRIMGA